MLIGLAMSVARNLGIGIIALLIPLVAEVISPETGLGFDVLLYWPFDFAYALFVGGIYIVTNQLFPTVNGAFGSFVVGLSYWLGWFTVSFLAVGQLHISLGYQL
jgi:hypothetical protein